MTLTAEREAIRARVERSQRKGIIVESLSQAVADRRTLLADLEVAERENKRLWKGLQKYGLHLYSDCLDKRRPCACGLGALLAPQPVELPRRVPRGWVEVTSGDVDCNHEGFVERPGPAIARCGNCGAEWAPPEGGSHAD